MKAKFAVLLLALVVVSLVALTGCSYPRVEVPNAHVGKVLTSSGFQKGIKTPSTFRLPLNILGLNPTELALVEASDQHKEEKMSLFMPKDRLIMEFDVRGTFTINSGEDDVEAILQRVPAYSGTYVTTKAGAHAVTVKAPSYTSLVDFDDVYAIYGQQIVLTKTRAVLSKYEIDYVLAHREEINAELENGVRESLAHTPLKVVSYGLSTVQPPDLIVEARKIAKERQVALQQAKADRLVRLTEAEAAYEVAKKQQMVDLLEADTNRQVGLELTRGVNPAFVQQRALTILENISNSPDRVILVPELALSNQAAMVAIHSSLMSKQDAKEPQKETAGSKAK